MGRRLAVGSLLCEGRFEVQGDLGEGGMGVVYRAFDHERGHAVALKGLSHMDATSLYRLKNEFRSLADVIHPNLVRLYELFVDAGVWLFSMELVDGVPFDVWVRPDDVLDEARLRAAFPQLVDGVAAIHAAGKLHRDLKPDNILVRPDGQVVILDFGLMIEQEPGVSYETLGEDRIFGTPAYMAPEQAEAGQVSRASDLYQIGVVLFEALTGDVPFDGSMFEVLTAKTEHDAPRARTLALDVPADLDELAAQLLARRPEDRPGIDRVPRSVAAAPVATPVDTSVPPTTTLALVGREVELEVLAEAYERVRRGRLTAVRVRGESGVGKSALVGAFLARLREVGKAVVLSGRCYERESVPYNAFDGLVDVLARYLRKLPEAEARALVPRNAAAMARMFPVLGRVECIAGAHRRGAEREADSRRAGFDGFTELLGRIGERAPLVLHVDDAQWMDDDSLLLLEHLCAEPSTVPFLLLLGQRPMDAAQQARQARVERAVGSADGGRLMELDLKPLSLEQAARLAGALLPDMPSRAELARAVASESAGSPFFVGELARYVAESVRPEGARQVSLEEAIVRRVEAVGEAARRLLELLAIAAKPVPAAVVIDAAGGAAQRHHELDLLRASQLVRLGAGRAYECYHDRTRDVVTSQMSPAARQDAHRRLAQAWLLRGDAEPELLYEHFVMAEDGPAAMEQAIAAAVRAVDGLAFERAASLYRKAMDLTDEAGADEHALHERLAECLSLAGRWREAGAAFEYAAQRAGSHRRRTYLTQHAAQHYLASGHREEGLPLIRQLFAALRVRWPRTRAGAMLATVVRLVMLRMTGARYRLVEPGEEDWQERFDGLGTTIEHWYPERPGERPREILRVDALLGGAALITPYDLARGFYYTTSFIVGALRTGEPSHVAVALGMLGVTMSATTWGRPFGQELAARSTALARERARPEAAAVSLGLSAVVRLWAGEVAAARDLSSEGVALLGAQSHANNYHAWMTRSIRNYSLALMGEIGEAARLSDELLRDARELGDNLAALGAENTLSAMLRDDPDAADRLVDDKLARIKDFEDGTLFHHSLAVEQVCCALYRGRGKEAMDLLPPARAVNVLPFDAELLRANCALQAIAEEGPKPRWTRALKQARRRASQPHPSGAINPAAAHLDAAECLRAGDEVGALRHMAAASESYRAAELHLHATLIDWRRGQLLGAAGAELKAQAAAFMERQGIVNPEGWANMLAAGLAPPARPGPGSA